MKLPSEIFPPLQETAFVCGIILVVLNLLLCFQGDFKSIVQGIVFACINSILVIGVHNQNRTAILIWMILAIIGIIILTIVFIIMVIWIGIPNHGSFQVGLFFFYAWYSSTIIFTIVTTCFAGMAMKKIKKDRSTSRAGGEQGISPFESFLLGLSNVRLMDFF